MGAPYIYDISRLRVKELGYGYELDYFGSGMGPVGGSCEQNNVPQG